MVRWLFCSLFLSASFLNAAAPPRPAPTRHGDRLRDGYFRLQARQLGDRALADIRSKADWEAQAPRLRREFLDMMGLWPLPPRTNLQVQSTGTLDTPHFTVEKLHYQSLPGLYVTANLYVPKNKKGPCPAVLYVCGHGPMVIDNVPYGNKVTYQHHPAWLAEHGYVCLIVDTLQLGEVPGLHHGTFRFGMWWWLSLGYTPAGVELWNAIRGLDYLESRPEVDRSRLAVTGRSGGGATSWWVGAADERVKVIIPVAGIADLLAHVSEGYPGRLADGVVAGHCDCMYMVNTYRWDYTQVIALCAPRALLLGNSDEDLIFPVEGYRRMAVRVKKLYELLGAGDRFAMLETRGPHKDTPELRQGAFRWLERWLKGSTAPIQEPDRPKLHPKQLKVFDRPPADALNDVLHQHFRRAVRLDLPESPAVGKAWWAGKAPELRRGLEERVFRGWPERPPELVFRPGGEVTHEGVRVRDFDFLSEEGVPLRTWLVQADTKESPREVIVAVADEAAWKQWLADLGPNFRSVLHRQGNLPPVPYPARDDKRFTQLQKTMSSMQLAFAIVAPRGVGPTRWSELGKFDGKPVGHQIRRRFYLLGQTLEGQQTWDIRRAVQGLTTLGEVKKAKLTLQGKGEMAALALYAALFEPGVASLDLRQMPATHRQGPVLLNVLSVLDLPQALALALPREIRLHVRDEEEARNWEWTLRLHRAMGNGSITVQKGE